jgi:hypothetical protein
VQLELAGGWRPIALLSTIGKTIEDIITKRIANAAGEKNLLPASQMGNRINRSFRELLLLLSLTSSNTTTPVLSCLPWSSNPCVSHTEYKGLPLIAQYVALYFL